MVNGFLARLMNDLEISNRTCSALDQRLTREEDEIKRLQRGIEEAFIGAVKADPATAALVERHNRAQSELTALYHIFSFLSHHQCNPARDYGCFDQSAA